MYQVQMTEGTNTEVESVNLARSYCAGLDPAFHPLKNTLWSRTTV